MLTLHRFLCASWKNFCWWLNKGWKKIFRGNFDRIFFHLFWTICSFVLNKFELDFLLVEMKNEVDLWSYKGLKESDVPNKRQKIATDADVKGKTLKLAPNQEKLATKQTSLLSFFSLSSTTSSKNETTVSSKIVTSETKVNRKIVSHETKMVDSGNKKCPFYKFIEGKNHLLGTGEHLNITGYTLVDHWLFSD